MSELSIEWFHQDSSGRAFGRAARRSARAGDRGSPRATRALDERALVARTLAGDPSAFGALVDRHDASFLRLAGAWCGDAAAAREIVNASWPAILDGLASFRFDRSLRTWMLGVVAARAIRRCQDVPASGRSAQRDEAGNDGEPSPFDAAGRWTEPPARWDEQAVGDDEVAAVVEAAISNLPSLERAVVTLRDVEGLCAEDACAVLNIGRSRQRSLLHGGRGRLRRALDRHLRDRPHARTPNPG